MLIYLSLIITGSDENLARILVTGGGGFIGSHLAEFFSKREDDVVVYDNLSRSNVLGRSSGSDLLNWNFLKDIGSIELVRGDIRDQEFLSENVGRPDVILHAAAQVAVTTSLKDPREDFTTNALGTFNLLELARRSDSKFIYFSTNKVYGENVNAFPVTEDGKRYRFLGDRLEYGVPETFPVDLTGHSPYGSSKFSADIYTQDYAHTYGLKTGIFRMSCIYGDRQMGVEDQGWVAWFIIASLTGKKITIYGDGKQTRDVLHISDLIAAVDKFLGSKISHDVFNIGGGPSNTLSLLELLDMIKSTTNNEPEIYFSDWRAADQRLYVSDIRKVKNDLDWKPRVSPQEGVRKVTEWVSSNRSLFTS